MSDWEQRALAWIARHTQGRVVDAAGIVTVLGETPVVWAAVAVAGATAAREGHGARAVRALVTLALSSLARRGVAELVGRARPPQRLWRAEWTGPSFPSRHTTLAGLGAGLAVDTLTADHRASLAAACAAAALVGASRLVLGIHWPSDVLGGGIFALVVLRVAHGHRAARSRRDRCRDGG